MRLFAKASAEHVSGPAAALQAEDVEPAAAPASESLQVVTKPEESTIIDLSSESAQQKAIADLTTLSRVLNTYFLYGTSPKNLEKLESLLMIAKNIPVTASLLMAVPSVIKDIRSASKGRGGKSKITAAATEVLNAWKDRMIAVGASGQSPKADGEAQNNDAEEGSANAEVAANVDPAAAGKDGVLGEGEANSSAMEIVQEVDRHNEEEEAP
jgi:hypothetical protein